MSEEKTTYIVAGDIGGTNSRFALHTPGASEPLLVHVYSNEEALGGKGSDDGGQDDPKSYHHATLRPFFEKALAEVEAFAHMDDEAFVERVQIVACLATAGPVDSIKNKVFMTNLGERGQVIDGAEIERSQDGLLKAVVRCKLVNDFVGQGYGALDLDLDSEVVELMPGSISKMNDLGPKVCVGAGTGLGECYLTRSSLAPGLGYECYPSEGGHVDFVPRDDLGVELWKHLREKFDGANRVSVERVVSGRGLANVYEFLAGRFPERVDKEIHDEFLGAGDQQGRVVGVNASKGGSLTELAARIMIASYGSEVGNAALKWIPTGGLYVTGGLTPKNIEMIKGPDSPFMKAYLDKGRLRPLLDTVPLFAVMTEDIGLRGARVCAEREYNAM